MRGIAVLLMVMLAGCAGVSPTEPVLDTLQSGAPLEYFELELSSSDCYTYHNIPFTDVGWPDQYLPPGYASADASSVWGMPVNFQFSAMGIGVFGCNGDDPWRLGVLHALVQPPHVGNISAVEPTTNPSPFTAYDGGFNFYALELYAEGELFDALHARGWNVVEANITVELPTQYRVVPRHGQNPIPILQATDGFWYTNENVEAVIRDDAGERSRFGNDLEVVWNHRNFEWVLFHTTEHGTGALEFTTGSDHLLVGRNTCHNRPGTLAHEVLTTLEWEGQVRATGNNDCPDESLGAMWTNFEAKASRIIDIPGAFPL